MIEQATLATVGFDRIHPSAYNPRKDLKPGDREWQDIDRSLQSFGLVQGLVWNKRNGNLVGGHQRLKVLQHHGWTEAICSVVDLDDEEERKLNIILNKVEGAWNKQRLGELLAELKGRGTTLETLGFTQPELNKLLKRVERKRLQDANASAPRPLETSLTRTGDVYDLVSADGKPSHRLICADATIIANLDKLMAGQRAQLLFTDPPSYGVAYLSQTRGEGTDVKRREIENDALKATALQEFLGKLFANSHAHTTDDAAAYIFHASSTQIVFEHAMNEAGWEVTQQLIWKKQMALSRADFHWNHEPCFYGKKQKQRRKWYGDRTQKTVFGDTAPDWRKMTKDEAIAMLRDLVETATTWEVERDAPSTYLHPTQKPIELCQRAMLNSTKEGDIVLDTCGGSGSTLIACEEDGRNARILEKDAIYCDVIVRRYMQTYQTWTVLRNGKEIGLADFEPANHGK